MQRSPSTGSNALVVAAVAFLGANLLHSADHLRQGLDGVTLEVKAGGALVTAAAVLALVAAVRRHPTAPAIATTVGFVAALLIVQSHVFPHWSVLSDSYIDDVDADVLSWLVVWLEIATGLILGVVGLNRLQSRRHA
jgi:hypothetical protein